MLKSARLFAVMLTVVAALGASAQDWRGQARVHGSVVDAATGKPIQGARVTLKLVRLDQGPPTIVTDARGRWASLGLDNGAWTIDIEAEGYLKKGTSVSLSELSRLPAMKIELEAAPPPAPEQKAEPVQETIQVGGVEISPEIAAAIEAGNNFIKEQKWKEAAVEYEKAVAVLPTNTALRFALSRSYYGSGQLEKAIGQLREIYTADSGNITAATLLADMLLESGKLDDAKTILTAIPAGGITDPNTVINLGIRYINNNKPDEAVKYFENAVALAPDLAVGYYYRAIANLQLKKMAEARKDLNKVIEMAPDATEAKDAKELLAQMK